MRLGATSKSGSLKAYRLASFTHATIRAEALGYEYRNPSRRAPRIYQPLVHRAGRRF